MLDDAIANHNPQWNGKFCLMRHSSVYETDADRDSVMAAIRQILSQFGNLMMKKGDVVNGFPEHVPLEELEGNVRVNPKDLEHNLLFGDPETVISKLKAYEALGVDSFIYYASMGMEMEQQKRSLDLFINKVMPAFNS